MSELQEIDLQVKSDGTVEVHVRGAQGDACLTLTGDIERLLGGDILERIYTDEFAQEGTQEVEGDHARVGQASIRDE